MRKPSWLLATTLVIAGCSSSPTPAGQAPAAQAQQQAAQATGGGGGSSDVAVSFKGQVLPILKEHCARCHVAGSASVPFTMFAADGSPQQETVAYRITDMIAAIRAKKMPKDAPGSVSEAEVSTLEAWAAQGSLDN